jgi:hypothetical protein
MLYHKPKICHSKGATFCRYIKGRQGRPWGQSSEAAAQGVKIWEAPETNVKTNMFLFANIALKIN